MDHVADASPEFAPDYATDPLFAPLRVPVPPGSSFVLGRVAQSLDGFIATSRGESVWISGPDDLRHTHRLRAWCDAIVVGAKTVRSDNPRLTTRLVDGPDPVRVVLDPDRRLDDSHHVFQSGPETLLVCALDASKEDTMGAARVLPVERGPAGLDIDAILTLLRSRGLRRILVEGGGVTVSKFLAAGALDRLHVTVAPLVIGGGVPAFPVRPVERLNDGRRLAWTAHRLGCDILLDIPLERVA